LRGVGSGQDALRGPCAGRGSSVAGVRERRGTIRQLCRCSAGAADVLALRRRPKRNATSTTTAVKANGPTGPAAIMRLAATSSPAAAPTEKTDGIVKAFFFLAVLYCPPAQAVNRALRAVRCACASVTGSFLPRRTVRTSRLRLSRRRGVLRPGAART